MGPMTKSVCEMLPSEMCDLYAPHPDPVDSRTIVKQYLLDPVLPLFTLLVMAVLTIALLVAVVMAVADMDLQLPDDYVSVDPRSAWGPASAGAATLSRIAFPDFGDPMEAMPERGLLSTQPLSDHPAEALDDTPPNLE